MNEVFFHDQVFTSENRTMVRSIVGKLLVDSSVMGLHGNSLEDLVQATFLSAWRGLGGFRRESDVKTWLHTIAKNEVMAILRTDADHYRAYARRGFDVPFWCGTKNQCRTPHHELVCADMKRILRQALRKLNSRSLRILRLRLDDELSFAEIAKEIGTTSATAKNALYRAKLVIRAEFLAAGVKA